MRAVALFVVMGVARLSHAHGPSGAHESPAWCGDRVAMLADGGVVVDATLVAVPVDQALIAWSPACDRIAVVGEKAFVIDAATHARTDLGALPGGFDRAYRLDGPAPSLRWAADGSAFAAVGVNRTIADMGLVRWELAKGTSAVFGVSGEIKAFALVAGDTAAVIVRAPRDAEATLVRVQLGAAAKRLGTGYKDARFSVAPVVAGAMKTSGALVRVDLVTGAETVLVSAIDYLQAMSADGTRALALVGGRVSAIDKTGVVPFDGALTYGAVADEQTGWSVDGALTVTRGDPGSRWVVSALGVKVRPWRGLPKGVVEHVTVAPDGKRAAFVLEISEPRAKGLRPCDFENNTRAELWTANLGAPARAKRLAVIAHLHSCGVE